MKEFRILQHIISCQKSQALNPKIPLLIFLLTKQEICPSLFLQASKFLRSPISKRPWVCYGLLPIKKLQNNCNSCLQNTLFRWHRAFNITTTSCACQQKVADEWSRDDLIVEVVPFQCYICDDTGHYEICPGPWGLYLHLYYDLTLHTMNHLGDLERYFFFPEKVIYLCEKYILWKPLNFLINLKN